MSPSVVPVRRSGSIAQRNARSRVVVTTRSVPPAMIRSTGAMEAGDNGRRETSRRTPSGKRPASRSCNMCAHGVEIWIALEDAGS